MLATTSLFYWGHFHISLIPGSFLPTNHIYMYGFLGHALSRIIIIKVAIIRLHLNYSATLNMRYSYYTVQC